VLAVGDAEFQAKCLGKIREVGRDGRTVVFVSHNMHAVARLCSRALVLHAGRIAFSGDTQAAVGAYTGLFARAAAEPEVSRRRPGSGEYRFASAAPDRPVYSSADPKRIRFRIVHDHSLLGSFYPSAHVLDESGVELLQMDGRFVGCRLSDAEEFQGECVIDHPWLKPGRYSVDLYLCTEAGIVDVFRRACQFEVDSLLPYPHSAAANATAAGLLLANFAWHVDRVADDTRVREVVQSAGVR
jgi:lipopolysaccharide transport system ATP-binding protein